jgi:hypothetical protein
VAPPPPPPPPPPAAQEVFPPTRPWPAAHGGHLCCTRETARPTSACSRQGAVALVVAAQAVFLPARLQKRRVGVLWKVAAFLPGRAGCGMVWRAIVTGFTILSFAAHIVWASRRCGDAERAFGCCR